MNAGPFRLLVDGHTFDVGPQGTTTFLAGILNAMPQLFERRTGRALEVYCATADRVNAERFLDIPFHHLPLAGGFAWRNVWSLPQLSRLVQANLTLSQYVRPLSLHGRSASVIHDVLFLDFPDLFSWSYRESRRILFGWSARHSDVTMTVSHYSRDRLHHWFGVPAASIAVIPNGVNPGPTVAPPAPQSGSRADHAASGQQRPLRLLCVSRFERRKRQDWCVQVVADLAKNGITAELHLVGAGSGNYADGLRQDVASAGAIGHAVHLHSGLTVNAMDRLMEQTDLVLFPSSCEGFGIPVIEGAAAGIPCVVADNTALSELRPYFTGPSFAGDSYGAFLAAVLDAAKDIAGLRQQAQAGAGAVAQAFNWHEAANSFIAALQDGGLT